MIDYADIGARIKAVRIKKGMTQEQLAESVGIGPSHMSHLENGKTVPSMEVFITLCNVLECSADELLCREIVTAEAIYNNWLTSLIKDYDPVESKILSDTLVCLKDTLRKNKVGE